MKNILFIAKMSKFETQNSPNRYYLLKFLEEKPNIKVLNDIPSNRLSYWIQTHGKPDIIIYYFLSNNNSLINIDIIDFLSVKKRYNLPCAMIFEDYHYTDRVYELYNKYQFDYFIQLGYNESVVNKLKHYYYIPFKLWNQYIDITKFTNRHYDSKKKIYDFLFYGYVDASIYPLRAKIYHVLKNLKITHKHINIKIIQHGNYNKNILKLPTQEELSSLLNQSRFSFATSSNYDIFVKKYIEIPLSGATIIGDIPSGYRELLKNNIIVLNKNASIVEIKKAILNAYNKKYSHVEKNNGKFSQLLKAKYSYYRGYNDLNNIVSDILSSEPKTSKNMLLFNPNHRFNIYGNHRPFTNKKFGIRFRMNNF